MPEYISEQDILNLLKKLDQDSRSSNLGLNQAASFTSQTMHVEQEAADGFIQVENGKIIVGNPSNGGEFPTLTSVPPVRLFVDGKVRKRHRVGDR